MKPRTAGVPTRVEEIDRTVQALVAIVTRCDPLQLLSAVFWHMVVRTAASSIDPVPDLPKEDVEWIWTLSYLGNLVAAVSPAPGIATLDPDEAALEARRLVGDLTTGLSEYLYDWSLQRKRGAAPWLDAEFLARLDWIHIRRSRFPRHDAIFVNRALSPHDEVLNRLWGIDAAALAAALDRQVNYHQFAPSLALARCMGIDVPGDDFLSLDAAIANPIGIEFLSRRDDPRFPRELREAAGGTFCDFGALSGLPASLLDALSWEPGGERNFLAPGEFCGWPLRITPLHLRPLLRIDGRYFCFNSDVLSTTLYRCMYWAIRSRDSSYMQLWEKRQRDVCEQFAAELFGKMLPGAQVLSNYYIDDPKSNGATRIERDRLFRYDDVLVVVECKGGNFALRSPATSFHAYARSLQRLVEKSIEQSMSVRSLLERGELIVYEQQTGEKEICRFRRDEFRAVICCGVMLESFPGPAAREAVFQALNEKQEGLPFWSVAMEDLLACVDLFDSPTGFLHFLEQRTRPGRPLALAMEELDHVSSYFRRQEPGHCPRVPEPGQMAFYLGGTEAIARTYWHDDLERRSPSNERAMSDGGSGSLFIEVCKYLDSCHHKGRARVAAALYGLSASDKERCITLLDQAALSAADGRGTLLASAAASLLIIATPARMPMLDVEARAIGLRFLKNLGTSEAIVAVVTLSRAGRLADMRWHFLRAGNLI